jgi:ADP-ribose pyrophosphatase
VLNHPVALPPVPKIELSIVRDHSAEAKATGGFLNVRRLELVAHFPDGTASAPFPYDIATRAALDVVAIVPHYVEAGVRYVYLRSSLRPPLAFRENPPAAGGVAWELPAGLIDAGETPAEAAARELEEEIGFHLAPSAMRPLGPTAYPVSGMCGESHAFFEVEVDPATRGTPSEDGSPLERGAAVVAIPFAEALEHCRTGAVRDVKTELALRRLAERI